MGVAEWTRGPAIGRGSSATVSIAVDRRTGGVLAVKSVAADRAAELRRERGILRGLSSPHVVRCLDAEDRSGGGLDMLMEYAPGGSLADEIRRCGGRCAEALVRSRARDILLGLAHVHAAGVAHCDVKGRNVLIASDGRALIADFGCARRTGGGIAGEERQRPTGGTPMFMAPEAARGEEQGPAADIWAVGCTVIEMATGAAPWQRFASPVATLHHVAFSGEAPEFPPCLSDQGKDFLARCLRQDPRERWTAEQLLEHEFVAAAGTASSSNSAPGITEKATFVSPKSVLDQALWEDDDDTTADTSDPTDRVRALAAGAPAVPDWTWDASWITVQAGPSGGADEEPAMSPEVGTDADSSDSSMGGSAGRAAAAEAGASSSHQASHANGDRYDGTGSCNGERSDDGDHVVSDCSTVPITSNGFF
uniref:Protein kinase domain-containing protein n=2 Tax=Aegilops tauschii subsp. strangulata TaxID=200361 RepID=A0A453S8S9_AEGTS